MCQLKCIKIYLFGCAILIYILFEAQWRLNMILLFCESRGIVLLIDSEHHLTKLIAFETRNDYVRTSDLQAVLDF
jgi:hypothetical protein